METLNQLILIILLSLIIQLILSIVFIVITLFLTPLRICDNTGVLDEEGQVVCPIHLCIRGASPPSAQAPDAVETLSPGGARREVKSEK